MENEKLFSKYYSNDTARYEDKEAFRKRILLYLEDFIPQSCLEPYRVRSECRSELGIDIETTTEKDRKWICKYHIEKAFDRKEISKILDFLTVVYDAAKNGYEKNPATLTQTQSVLMEYVNKVNKIFQDESMCYVMYENGRVRYYPDEEFHKSVRSTLAILDNPKYATYLTMFNEVLNELYRNHDKERPIVELFKLVESFLLSLIGDKQLDRSSTSKLMNIAKNKLQIKNRYTPNDEEAFEKIGCIFSDWKTMCHKYRHAKPDQANQDIPKELFNFIFSTGISIFRFFLEVDTQNVG